MNNELFGMVECDISVPKTWAKGFERRMPPSEYFAEMSPIFCTTEVGFEHLSPEMKNYVVRGGLSRNSRRLLVGGMKAEKILLATPLLQWYLQHGLQITKIYLVMEYVPNACFRDFQQEVSDARRRGDADPTLSIIADTMKLLGNSAYGSMIMDKEKHKSVIYVKGEVNGKMKVNQRNFQSLTELGGEMYEIEMAKKTINLNLPITLGYFILQYAKLRMLQFYYDCIDRYLHRGDYEYIEMDTDSAYLGLSGDNLRDVIRPELKDEFDKKIMQSCAVNKFFASDDHWFPRECCEKHIKHDKRTPGLFKLEASGKEMIALNSKTYLLQQENDFKMSCKGINKLSVENPLKIFHNCLFDKQTAGGSNRGFRARENTIFSYTQEKRGFGYFYSKR